MSLKNNQQLLRKDILDEIASTYYYSTDIRVKVIDSSGNTIEAYGKKPRFCTFFNDHTKCDYCKDAHIKSAKRAVEFGDTYVFFCPAGLTHYVAPLLYNKTLLGALIAGPIMMEYPNELFINDFMQKYSIELDYKSMLMTYLREIPVIGTTKVRYYSKLLFYISLSVLQSHIEILNQNRERANQQSKISETIHFSKSEGLRQYPYDKEKELYSKVRSGDVIGARKLLNEILGHIFFTEGNKLEIIKSRIIELCSVLSRAAVEGGASIEDIFKINTHFMHELSTADNVEELSFWLLKVLDIFTENVLEISETQNRHIIEKALLYIHQNYTQEISLAQVANEVHLNPTYFSTLFKKETGTSFTSYINKMRIEKAKYLLHSTNNSILEVAIAVGFEDQSYFCKVFKRLTGITPKQYRALNLYQ